MDDLKLIAQALELKQDIKDHQGSVAHYFDAALQAPDFNTKNAHSNNAYKHEGLLEEAQVSFTLISNQIHSLMEAIEQEACTHPEGTWIRKQFDKRWDNVNDCWEKINCVFWDAD